MPKTMDWLVVEKPIEYTVEDESFTDTARQVAVGQKISIELDSRKGLEQAQTGKKGFYSAKVMSLHGDQTRVKFGRTGYEAEIRLNDFHWSMVERSLIGKAMADNIEGMCYKTQVLDTNSGLYQVQFPTPLHEGDPNPNPDLNPNPKPLHVKAPNGQSGPSTRTTKRMVGCGSGSKR